jgi:arginyl-tRNA synthetase
MKGEIESVIAAVCNDLFDSDIRVELTRPNEKFGDYATNVALQLAKKLNENPREMAEQIAVNVRNKLGSRVSEISVDGPGFINITLSDRELLASVNISPAKFLDNMVVVSEYSDPSSFKVLHAGHLYTSMVGDAISNLFEISGGEVHRVNFGGDVGRHVAITMWAILKELGGENPDILATVPDDQRTDWMSERYVQGNAAYETNDQVKAEVTIINKRVYQLHDNNDHDSAFARIYWTCRQWSYDYFDEFYERIGSHFEKYYPESETMQQGLKTVREQLKNGVYEESDGAIIFRGEKYGLHTRVFINSQGLPTYEAKDVGLIMEKWNDFHFDKSFILTDNAQAEYMTVVVKSIEQFAPKLARATIHRTHGRVKLTGGQKMSSRTGNIVRAIDVLDIAKDAYKKTTGRENEQAVLGAVKYAFLKQRLGADIIYDPNESVSLEGNSGPYIQYAHARARSILANANTEDVETDNLESGERSLARKLTEYTEVVEKAASEYMPHYICTYLYELGQVFNRFYENNHVIGDKRQSIRLHLVLLYADILKNGLALLGISAPDKM